MSVLENQYLGKINQVEKDKAPQKNLFLWTIGYFIGNILFLFLLTTKAIGVYFAWNFLMPSSHFPMITTDSAFGLAAIISLASHKYQTTSMPEIVVDSLFKIFLIYTVSLCLNFY